MVLVSNEWQNKSEDVPNTTTVAGTNTTTPPATSTETSSTAAASIAEFIPSTATKTIKKNNKNNSEAVAGDFLNSITATDSNISASAIATIATTATGTAISEIKTNDQNATIEQINEIIKDKKSIEIEYKNKKNEADPDADTCTNEYKNTEVGKLLNTFKQLKLEEGEDNLEESNLNYNISIKRMAENTKESPLKEEKEVEEQLSQLLINNHYAGNNKELDESNSYQNSNTNTLTTIPVTDKTEELNQQPKKQKQFGNPISPQALSCALQTALSATNNANNTVAAAGLQPNFLSQLALTANVAGLQKSATTITAPTILTAKQLNQSFNMLDTSNQNKSDSNLLEDTTSISVPAETYDDNGRAKIVLMCESNSHPFETRTISLTPNVECMVGRLIAKSKAASVNGIFDCKVLSRKHAVIWYTPDGKFWVKDTKSSNGTFINDNKLGDEEAELHFGDIVKFGVDVLENSRKEIHGCIIACVKLYLPDGREAISIDSSAHRSQYSGEGRISYDELHRLNLYIQETSQREKVLTSKLCNIQNVLDATRKNSALCWQSLVTEDQLLHRIHSLEKKLQFMEKNVPENILRNEVIKLLDDKSSYQHSAKEALRKLYQERFDAMQMLSKMESAYTQSDNECSLLRDQIMNSKQTLQEVNTRLLRLETEYNEYRDEMKRQQQEAKDREEQHIEELSQKLCACELECEVLKNKISDILIKHAELGDDEKQAIEKLDAAIADMDLGDDEDSSCEDENDEVDIEKKESREEQQQAKQRTDEISEQNNTPHFASIFADKLNGAEEEQQHQDNSQKKSNAHKLSKLKKGKAFYTSKDKSQPKRVKETTIMKWLQNSDLNKNEGSSDIFKAICNENENDEDESESEDCDIFTEQKKMPDSSASNETSLLGNFTTKLKNVQKNLKQLEAEIENETKNQTCAKDKVQAKERSESVDEDSSDEDDGDNVNEGACAEEEFVIKSNGNTSTPSQNQVLSTENKKYLLLKSSVNMLREAYNEIRGSVRDQEEAESHKENNNEQLEDKEDSSHINVKVKTQCQEYNTSPTAVTTKKSNKPTTILRLSESDNTESDSEIESLTLSSSVNSIHSRTVVNVKTHDSENTQKLLEQLREYETQVGGLNKKLEKTELEAQHTLEIMQVECDDVKLKMENLNKIIETLKDDKKALQQVINEKQNSADAFETSSTVSTKLEEELDFDEDLLLNNINVTALEREEELITYKERLDDQLKQNIDLRNEIALLKLKTSAGTTKDLWFKQYLPCGIIVAAIIIYFLTSYY